MLKVENTEVFGWEAAIRELYNGKGVRWVYPNSYEAYISTHGKFLSCGTYPTEEQAREAVVITKIKLFEASVIAHGDNPSEIVESVENGYFASASGNIYNRHGDLMIGEIDHCGYRHTILNRKNRNVHPENTIHAYQTGLEQKYCGENHHSHKLTKEDVEYIKRKYIKRDSEFGAVALANKFGVDRTSIHDIIRGKTWREVV